MAVADDLDLGLVRDCFEVWVQDGALGGEGGGVAVGGGEGVEELGYVVLGAGGEGGLVFEEEDLVGVEGGLDDFFVGGGQRVEVGIVDLGADGVGCSWAWGEGLHGDVGGGCVGHF